MPWAFSVNVYRKSDGLLSCSIFYAVCLKPPLPAEPILARGRHQAQCDHIPRRDGGRRTGQQKLVCAASYNFFVDGTHCVLRMVDLVVLISNGQVVADAT
jgi:hypothetical protein